jgi:hypothetical protein
MMEEFRPEGGHNDAWWGFKKTNTKYTAVGDANEGDVSRRTRAERDGTFTDERGRRSSCVRPSPRIDAFLSQRACQWYGGMTNKLLPAICVRLPAPRAFFFLARKKLLHETTTND